MVEIKKVTVIGSGIMGSGIANAVFKRGFEVTLFDLVPGVADQAVAAIRQGARRNMDPQKVRAAATLEEAARDVDVVIEAVVEDLEVKRRLFRALETVAPPSAILASNTSSLAISDLARGSARPERILGTHFFNPAVIMRLVEIITPPATSPGVVDAVGRFLVAIGKTGIPVKESPGFVVNRILVPLLNEAFYLLAEYRGRTGLSEVAQAGEIDAALEISEWLPLGPFNLGDLIGLDTAAKVAEIIYQGFSRHPRYLPAPLLQARAGAGHFGRKAGRGTYYYENTQADPDRNPARDESGLPITRLAAPAFPALDLAATMVNEGFRVLEEGLVASFRDVETCLELGARWPKGPFALAKSIGSVRILATLEARTRASGDPHRYQPSALLRSPPEEVRVYLQNQEN